MKKLIIKNARYILTLDTSRQVIRDGAVVIKDDRIAWIGKTSELDPSQEENSEVIDASGQIVAPGLINCHFHSTQQLARGLGDGLFLQTYIHERIFPFEAALSEDDVYVSALCACIEAIKTGTTCFVDPGGYHMERVAEAVEKSGSRAILQRSLVDLHSGASPVPGKLRESTAQAIQVGEDFVRHYHGYAKGRIRAWFSLRTERTTSSELITAVKELADHYQVGVSSHVSNQLDSVERHKELFHGITPVKRFEQAGLLGSNLMIFHANHLTPEEIEMIIAHDVKVIHCPTSARASASGSLKAQHIYMKKRGVTVAVATDTAACSNTNDMHAAMYALTAHRDVKKDPTLLPPEEILEMATIEAAKAALWAEEIGSLEVGKKADLIVYDILEPSLVPLHNPVANIVHSASGANVNTTIVDGRVLMKNRSLVTLDEEAILREGQIRARNAAARSGLAHLGPAWKMV